MKKVVIIIVSLFVFIALSYTSLAFFLGVNPLKELKSRYFCIGEGEKGNYFNGDKCCSNLKEVVALSVVKNKTALDYRERCSVSGAGGHFLCTKCGNGTCEKIENVCNCPDDCFK